MLINKTVCNKNIFYVFFKWNSTWSEVIQNWFPHQHEVDSSLLSSLWQGLGSWTLQQLEVIIKS